MRAAPHPDNEKRIAALRSYNILDTPRESDFDDIVALAARICETPISVVNLIDDDRQWFKAEVGLNARETPLDTSICSHVILDDEFVEIPDTLTDPRMADNPLCQDNPGLRFYAGAQLITDTGLPLGTLCVLGNEPRELNELQRETLRVLSRQVMNQLDLRRTLHNEQTLRAEMDHRIKNSLQATSSLIRIYTRAVKDDTAREALEAVHRRIDGMSALHDHLQRSNLQGSVGMSGYLEDLIGSLRETTPENITLTLRVDDISLPFNFATDVGIILSEFVANTIKYGYPDGAEGTVNITLDKSDDGTLILHASDNGLGSAAPAPEASRVSGIGNKIVAAAASNLGGTLNQNLTEDGAQLTLMFEAH
jgi:two-component sensor histidine kinase